MPFYDEYARTLRSKLVVLVFISNDLMDNSAILSTLHGGWDPEHFPYASTERGPDGEMKLRPPHPEHERFKHRYWVPRPPVPESWARTVKRKAKEIS